MSYPAESKGKSLTVGIEMNENVGSCIMMRQLCEKSYHIFIALVELIGYVMAFKQAAEGCYNRVHYLFVHNYHPPLIGYFQWICCEYIIS